MELVFDLLPSVLFHHMRKYINNIEEKCKHQWLYVVNKTANIYFLFLNE